MVGGNRKTSIWIIIPCLMVVYLVLAWSFTSHQQRNTSLGKQYKLISTGMSRTENSSTTEEQPKVKVTHQHSWKTEKPCKPFRKFIYIKTMKTGSSTLACILFRYGLKNGLIAALQQRAGARIVYRASSENYNILQYDCKNFQGYDFIANHIFYHRAAMENIVKDAKYITILRSPYTRLRSKFFYSNKYRHYIDPASEPNPLLAFLKLLERSGSTEQDCCCVSLEANDLSRRLGVCATNREDLTDNIQQLDRELDLVLLTEYYDESLILLKKLMCWEFEDIVYHSQKIYKNPLPPITSKMKSIVDKISIADLQLYNHFNKTFWEKVKNYDGDFEADLAEFRNIKKKVTEKCENAPTSQYCNLLFMDTLPTTRLIYDKQLKFLCTNPKNDSDLLHTGK
ncbi:galactosylceramide sulfotransferase-like [Ptychodera flava]|uniref:galactosylceramide sulfotransferase-like n=1 Tax=Ptychodera flava TaxID=63121 RepID=UPI00396AA981